MSGVLALAAALATLERASLAQIAVDRQLTGHSAINDPLDFSSAILRPEAVRRGLALAPRRVLLALHPRAHPEAHPGALSEALKRGLIGLDGERVLLLDEVSFALEQAFPDAEDLGGNSPIPRTPLPDPASLGQSSPIPTEGAAGTAAAGASGASDASEYAEAHPSLRGDWAEAALDTVRVASQVLRGVAEQPGLLRAHQGVAVSTLKTLGAHAGAEPQEVSDVLRMLGTLGLIARLPEPVRAREGTRFAVTAAAAPWLSLTREERWAQLATAATLPLSETFLLAQAEFPEWPWEMLAEQGVRALFPLVEPTAVDAVRDAVRRAERVGVLEAGFPSEAGAAVLREDTAAALAAATARFPSTITQVYVQPDLSIIAPGPLEPALEQDLLSFATLEQSGLASTYRVSRASVEQALHRGASEESLRAFLGQHSLTGIPQPLDYLLKDVASRHGSLVVSARPDGSGQALVTARDPAVLATMLVDSGLRHFGLEQVSERTAHSRFHPDQVRAALREARLPVAADREGAFLPELAVPNPALFPGTGVTSPAGPQAQAAELAERVYLAARSNPDSADVERIALLAAKEKSLLLVTVTAGQQTRTFRLRPSSVINGRLRGVDEAADVERTLPLKQVTSLEVIPAGVSLG